jgi:alginate O-acetyltransferase complex protein AlgJ
MKKFPFYCRAGAVALVATVSLSLNLVSCASGKQEPATDAPAASAEGQQQRPTALPPAPSTPTTLFEMNVVDADRQVRVVGKPTLAALDFAAYSVNPIRLAGKDEKPENYAGKMAGAKLPEYPFPMLD